MFKRLRLFRTPSKRREQASNARRRMLLQQALLERFRLVPGVTGGRGCVSFACFTKPHYFLCHREKILVIDRYKDSQDYKTEATFVILENMWFQGFFAFECLTNPGWFITRTTSGLSLQRYNGKEEFKENASFKLSRKKCLSCAVPVTHGVRVWIRVNNMCFTRGVVTKDGPELHIVTTKGKLEKCHRNRPDFLAIDKIPNPHDVGPGTRVVARWHDRLEPYYLGTVVGRQGGKYVISYDDDDEAVCDLKHIRVLLWTESSAARDVFEQPSWSSLEDIPRLSSGMLLNDVSCEKTKMKRNQMWNSYRKISVSDQHLDIRKRQNSVPSFLSKTSSCRETNAKPVHWSCFYENNAVTTRSSRSSLGNGQERREPTRKNGVATAPKFV